MTMSVSCYRIASAAGLSPPKHSGGILYLCPIHDDTDPSLSIEEGRWYCHGCQTGGNYWKFVGFLNRWNPDQNRDPAMVQSSRIVERRVVESASQNPADA